MENQKMSAVGLGNTRISITFAQKSPWTLQQTMNRESRPLVTDEPVEFEK
jgi:hypothetical protein